MKRETKAQKEAKAKAALLRRVTDIYSGALGMEWDADQFATAEVLASVLPAIRDLLKPQEWMLNLHALKNYDTAETAAAFLYEYGVRA